MTYRTPSPEILDEFFASGYEETENPFIAKSSRNWGKHAPLIGALTAAFFLFLAYVTHFTHPPLESLFLVFVFFLSGTPALIHSLRDIFTFDINIQVLMTLAAFLSVLIGNGIEGGLLLVLFALSEALEDMVTKKTKGALGTLHKLSPSTAFIVESDGSVYAKSVKEITLGMRILVKAGEVIPLDGVVDSGNSFVNLAHLTGESVPISKKRGDEVQAGSINMDGSLTLSVTKTSADSTLAKIIRLITEAGEAKPKLQKLLDQFGRAYAMSVILLSFSFAIFIPLLFHIPYLGFEGSIYRALAFLIAASPCALIIATPTAYLSAISACARKGILLKGGVVLDALATCKTLAFDKTGTLTTGKLTCSSIEIDGEEISLEEGLSISASLERAVVHPIADAVLTYTKEMIPKELFNLKVLPGKGVEGYLTEGGQYVVIGNEELILSKIQDPNRKLTLQSKIRKGGHVVTLLLVKETVLIFHFLDEIRPDMKEVVETLKKELEIVMLTGDHKENAENVGKALGIKQVFSDLKPEDKLRIVTQLAEQKPLIMVGDGINDAPALARAMIGIAMGEVGSQTAIDSADIVLLRDNLSMISWLYKRAKKTRRIVRQNVSLALLVIFTATFLSLFGIIPLWLAVILHEGSTVTVGLNSLRLLKT